MDDSEVTLNVCLGNQFSGGELYFRGVRCDNHVNSEIKVLVKTKPNQPINQVVDVVPFSSYHHH